MKIKYVIMIIAIIFSNFYVFSESSELSVVNEKMQGITFNEEAYNSSLLSPVNGEVIKTEKNAESTSIVIKCTTSYYLNGVKSNSVYELIITNIADYIRSEKIDLETNLGLITNKTKIVARNTMLDPYMIRETTNPPQKIGDYYYFVPSWINPTRTDTLSFRQVDSFENAVIDFYTRWKSENDTNEKSFATIHYFPNLDRIRVKIKLNQYPTVAKRTPALGLTETTYYGRSIFILENVIDSKCEYKPVLYWQKGFDSYLRKEYNLNDDIYIYCSIYTLDHINKKIVICVRDFSKVSDEEIIGKRIKDFSQ